MEGVVFLLFGIVLRIVGLFDMNFVSLKLFFVSSDVRLFVICMVIFLFFSVFNMLLI